VSTVKQLLENRKQRHRRWVKAFVIGDSAKVLTFDLRNLIQAIFAKSGWTEIANLKNPVQPPANYDASNPVESSGIVGKNFPFDVRIEALHRFEPGNRVELA
jgi:hypothetical protein